MKKVFSLCLAMLLLVSCFFFAAGTVNAASLSTPRKPSVSTTIEGENYKRVWLFGYYESFSKTMKVTWNKIDGADGYEFYYKINSCTPEVKTVKQNSYTLKARTSFYLPVSGKIQVKVRAFDVVNGVKVYSSWSPVRTIYM